MSKVKGGKADTKIRICPKCKKFVFTAERNKKFCPSCNYYFEHSSMKEEKKRLKQIEYKSKKQGRLLFLVAVIISLVVISFTAYFYWYPDTETDEDSLYYTLYPRDQNREGIPGFIDPDRDGDGVLNVDDAYPDDSERWERQENAEEGDGKVLWLVGVVLVVFLVGAIVGILMFGMRRKGKEE